MNLLSSTNVINIPYLNDSTYYLPSHYHGAPHIQPDAGQSGS